MYAKVGNIMERNMERNEALITVEALTKHKSKITNFSIIHFALLTHLDRKSVV